MSFLAYRAVRDPQTNHVDGRLRQSSDRWRHGRTCNSGGPFELLNQVAVVRIRRHNQNRSGLLLTGHVEECRVAYIGIRQIKSSSRISATVTAGARRRKHGSLNHIHGRRSDRKLDLEIAACRAITRWQHAEVLSVERVRVDVLDDICPYSQEANLVSLVSQDDAGKIEYRTLWISSGNRDA